MSKHTPGPWTLGTKTIWENNGYKVHAFPVAGSGQAVAAVWAGSLGKGRFGFDNQEANARLIAAAPDLLAALKQVRNSLALRGHRTKEQEQLLGMVRAAIAKAEGTLLGGGDGTV